MTASREDPTLTCAALGRPCSLISPCREKGDLPLLRPGSSHAQVGLKQKVWGFPDGPLVVRTLVLSAMGLGSIPAWETNIL